MIHLSCVHIVINVDIQYLVFVFTTGLVEPKLVNILCFHTAGNKP